MVIVQSMLLWKKTVLAKNIDEICFDTQFDRIKVKIKMYTKKDV